MLKWEVEYTDEFEAWWNTLNGAEQEAIGHDIDILEARGTRLGRPRVDTVKGSRFSNMKELRTQCGGDPYRVLFAFDPRRCAILLIGGDKKGDDRPVVCRTSWAVEAGRIDLMAKKWSDLKAKMSPDARARVDARMKETLASMPLAEIRKAVGLTQQEIAKNLEMGQGSVSKIERAADMYLSTLRKFVEGMGGELRLVARFPDGRELEIDHVEDLGQSGAAA